MADDLQLLAKFLTESDEFSQTLAENDKEPPKNLKKPVKKEKVLSKKEASVVHEKTCDSSDDEYGESNRSIVQNLKKKVSNSGPVRTKNESLTKSWDQKRTSAATAPSTSTAIPKSSAADLNVFVDPIFRMRLVNPLFSSATLKERAQGRTPVGIHELSRYLLKKDFDKADWFTAGIVVSKSSKASSKGALYTILTLSDLHSGLKSFSLFLFGKCHTELSKIGVATAIGILNPSPLDNRSNKEEAALTIRSPDQVIVWGISKDYGTCKSVKSNGDVCNAFVNVHVCKTCIYHLNSEYKKFSQRIPASFSKMEKNSRNAKKGGLFFNEAPSSLHPAKKNMTMMAKDRAIINSLMNSESNKPLSSVENTTQKKNDTPQPTFFETRLANSRNAPSSSKSGVPVKFTEFFTKTKSPTTAPSASQKKPDAAKRSDISDGVNRTIKSEKKVCDTSSIKSAPKPSNSNSSGRGMIDLDNIQKPSLNTEKSFTYEDFLALKKGKRKEPTEDKHETPPTKKVKSSNEPNTKPNTEQKVDLELSFSFDPEISLMNRQTDPNSVAAKAPSTSSNVTPSSILSAVKGFLPKNPREKAKEKALEYIKKHGPLPNAAAPKPRKSLEKFKEEEVKPKTELGTKSAEFERLLNMKSRNSVLVAAADVAAQEEYFDKLEKKEQLENKMTSTFKVETKAFICFDCKYTWYSLSERCLREKHKTKSITTNKRFFTCGNCKLKKTILDRVPKGACERCGAYQWEKAAMMSARKVELPVPKLSIRGDEEAHYGNAVAGNLNLLVPDEEK